MTCEAVKSTHRVEIVPVELTKHPNADSLSIIPVFGYTCVGRTADWQGVTRAAFIPPDSTVDVSRPDFSFLADRAKSDGRARIKAIRLRGVVSYGLLIPVPNDTPLGDDWAERLGVQHYEPPLEHETGDKRLSYTGGEAASAPHVYSVKYDVDAFRRYHHLFEPGEPVFVTEKLDGCNARYCWWDGRMHCGSRTEWKKEYPDHSHVTIETLTAAGKSYTEAEEIVERLRSQPRRRNLWWENLDKHPAIEEFCRSHPGSVLYGEIYGSVNCIKYGFSDGNRFAAFDVLHDGKWVDAVQAAQMLATAGVPFVPIVEHLGGYDFDAVCKLAEGDTLCKQARAGTIREGVVVKPVVEREDKHIGRVCFKVINPTFLERYR